jgi:hypothetical protein
MYGLIWHRYLKAHRSILYNSLLLADGDSAAGTGHRI